MPGQREVADGEGTRWTCVQAFAGTAGDASEGAAATAAAKVVARETGGAPGTVAVVCTPAGGESSVRIALRPDWADAMDDDALAAAVAAARADG